MISYAGVLLSLNPVNLTDPVGLSAWIRDKLDPEEVMEGILRGWPGKGLDHLGWYGVLRRRRIDVGTLRWPWSASRFAIGHFLADNDQLAAIRQLVYQNGSYSPQPLIISDGVTAMTASLWMLAPRPLAQDSDGLSGLWLLTLVDIRYFWWYRAAQINVAEGSTTWADLYQQIAVALGITLTADPIADAYLLPTAALTTAYRALPILLDVVAAAVGQRIVVQYDGVTVEALGPESAINRMLFTLASPAVAGEVISGGVASVLDDRPRLPQSVTLVCPRLDNGIFTDTYTTYVITLQALALTDIPEVAGFVGTKVIHTAQTAKWNGGLAPLNDADLTALVIQTAADYYHWTAYGIVSRAFRGVVVPLLEGLHDASWHHPNHEILTRLEPAPGMPDLDTNLKLTPSTYISGSGGAGNAGGCCWACYLVSWKAFKQSVNTAWDSGSAYVAGDVTTAASVVTLDGYRYQCILDNTNETPPNATYWKLLGPVTDAVGVPLFTIPGNSLVTGAYAYDTIAFDGGTTLNVGYSDNTPVWDATISYAAGDVVSSGGNLYTCILANSNETPPNATYWTLLSAEISDPAAYISGFALTAGNSTYPMISGASVMPSHGLPVTIMADTNQDADLTEGCVKIAVETAALINCGVIGEGCETVDSSCLCPTCYKITIDNSSEVPFCGTSMDGESATMAEVSCGVYEFTGSNAGVVGCDIQNMKVRFVVTDAIDFPANCTCDGLISGAEGFLYVWVGGNPIVDDGHGQGVFGPVSNDPRFGHPDACRVYSVVSNQGGYFNQFISNFFIEPCTMMMKSRAAARAGKPRVSIAEQGQMKRRTVNCQELKRQGKPCPEDARAR